MGGCRAQISKFQLLLVYIATTNRIKSDFYRPQPAASSESKWDGNE